jgi:hypothetical protein
VPRKYEPEPDEVDQRSDLVVYFDPLDFDKLRSRAALVGEQEADLVRQYLPQNVNPVNVEVKETPTPQVCISLDAGGRYQLDAHAEAFELSASELVRRWVLGGLRTEDLAEELRLLKDLGN